MGLAEASWPDPMVAPPRRAARRADGADTLLQPLPDPEAPSERAASAADTAGEPTHAAHEWWLAATAG
eukprot:312789-Chlamydomonas_euryale.AAC.1